MKNFKKWQIGLILILAAVMIYASFLVGRNYGTIMNHIEEYKYCYIIAASVVMPIAFTIMENRSLSERQKKVFQRIVIPGITMTTISTLFIIGIFHFAKLENFVLSLEMISYITVGSSLSLIALPGLLYVYLDTVEENKITE